MDLVFAKVTVRVWAVTVDLHKPSYVDFALLLAKLFDI
jgi:hypothetical protein